MTPRDADLGALVLFTKDLVRSAAFYRAIGLPLEEERHDEGPVHYACAPRGLHFALFEYPGDGAPGYRIAGGTMPGFRVDSVRDALASLRKLGTPVIREPEEMPWGLRAIVEDPDGRAVEIFESEEPLLA
jgi:lactoylglutathione lyase